MTTPLVSIIIPAYNVQDYIEECINSALNQTYPNIEIIVVDNNSTDQTLEIVKDFKRRHPDLITILLEKKQGASNARNKGFILGFDPEFKIYHPVLRHKLALMWHLKSAFAHGRDGEKSRNEYQLWSTILLLLKSTVALIIKLPIYLFKTVLKENYYWQNAVLDSFSPIFYRWGQVKSKFL